jgi:hypothetical protein
MTENNQRILDKVRSSLGGDQLASAIVYVGRAQIHAGVRVQFGDALIEVPWEAHIAFVDLEPGANWGHACCYLAIRRDADDVIKVSARMPPFLKAEPSAFRLLWRGPLAPKWAVVTGSD